MMTVQDYCRKPIPDCSNTELFNAVLQYTCDAAAKKGYNEGKKKLYYLSAEFLIGKLLSNNLINLGLYEDVRDELKQYGRDIEDLEELETEPSLGNGGLGRLAACFLDSLATLGFPADGIGLAYHCGLFHQVFTANKQYEIPDYWMKWGRENWLKKTDVSYVIPFGDFSLRSVMYELDVIGYEGKCGRLRLFDVEDVDEGLIKDSIRFDKRNIARNLTLFLYPDDSDEDGRLLRLYQETFLVANAANLILQECRDRGSNMHDLADYAAIQINDTHPALVIPQLIFLLEQEGIGFMEALSIVENVCGYTNHTILAEALETWPKDALAKVSPCLLAVIERLNQHFRELYTDPFVRIIDENGRIHMANIAIHCSHSINGVARLHTDILRETELVPFARIYPDRFNNKTNGITFRRWLIMANPDLSALISGTIGDEWTRDSVQLEKLLAFKQDRNFLESLLQVKKNRKKVFSTYLAGHGIVVDPESIFDVQVKRLHEYKRQQLNLLWAVQYYLRLKEGYAPEKPVTVIFGAKAAPAYTIAKDIIHAILCFAQVVEEDPEVSRYLKIIMLENYNVTMAGKLIPAADISEQISLASKEASGTSNMKFMLNGAVTLGTMDGANVEIAELVGKDHIYTFGKSSDEVIDLYQKGTYRSFSFYEADPVLKQAVDFLVEKKMLACGDETSLQRLYNNLLEKDWFMTFPDFSEYCSVKDRALREYNDRYSWAEKMLVNTAMAGYFSSDRTIGQYNQDIWHLK